jgi:AraC-like DNA-binding protein
MCAKIRKKQIAEINQMLLELASGNPFYRLSRSNKDDSIEGIVVLINMLAEEIQQLLLHQGSVNAKGIIKHIVQMSFILDDDGIIQMINQKTVAILATFYDDIIKKPFESFLTEDSRTKWQKTWNVLKQKDFKDISLELTFEAKQKLLVPSQCYITRFSDKETGLKNTLITVIHYYNTQDKLENDLKESIVEFIDRQKTIVNKSKKQRLRLDQKDIRRIRAGHDIIMNNLEKDLPFLKDFALQLGTNEFKLKYGFKELYGISVYRFLTRERLSKSKMLIQFTELPIKSIINMTGFKSSAHFSKTFKNRYGYAPSILRKKSLKDKK